MSVFVKLTPVLRQQNNLWRVRTVPVALCKAGSQDCECNQAEEGSTNFSKKNMGDQVGQVYLPRRTLPHIVRESNNLWRVAKW